MATTPPPDPLPPNHNIGPILEITSYVFIFPTVFTTALRLWVRIRERTLGADDATMVVAMCLAIVLSALSIEAVHSGKGRHVWYLSTEQQERISMLSWANQVVLFCAICMIKVSISLLILRIKQSKWLKWVLYTTIALLAATNLVPIIALCIECQPTNGFWMRTAPGVTCRSPNFRIYSIYLQSAYSILTDCALAVLPTIIVWQLNLSKKKKIGVCVLMSLGLVCTAFAGLRAASLGTNITDSSYEYTYSGTWSTIEINLGIVAANLAPIRALIIKLFPVLQTRYTFPRGTSSNRFPTHNSTRTGGGGTRPDPYDEEAIGIASTKRSRHRNSSTSDRSQIPLKDVLQTREVKVDYADAHSAGSDGGRNYERQPWEIQD